MYFNSLGELFAQDVNSLTVSSRIQMKDIRSDLNSLTSKPSKYEIYDKNTTIYE